jgi:chromosome segregation ATPase
MIEQAMIFTLGFLLAGILALAVTPAFWRRAVRLARRRIDAQVPVSIGEILAERDQLRAQNAVECRRIEDRAAALNRRHAADLSELGQRAAKLVAMETDLAAHKEASGALLAENTRLLRELAQTNAQAAAAQKALYDADGVYENKSDEIIELSQTLSSVSALAEVRQASLTTSDNYSKDLERRIAALRADLATVQTRLKDKTREADEAGDLLRTARTDLAKTQKRLELEFLRSADLETAANALRLERKADAAEMRSLNLKLETSQADLRDARARESASQTKQTEQIERAREGEGQFAKQLHILQSDNAALQGALDVARRRCDELERDLASLRRGDAARQSAAAESPDAALARIRAAAAASEARDSALTPRPAPASGLPKSGVARDEAEASG